MVIQSSAVSSLASSLRLSCGVQRASLAVALFDRLLVITEAAAELLLAVAPNHPLGLTAQAMGLIKRGE